MGKNGDSRGDPAAAFGGGAVLGAAAGFGLGRVTAPKSAEIPPAEDITGALNNITAVLQGISGQISVLTAGQEVIAADTARLLQAVSLMAPTFPGEPETRLLEPFRKDNVDLTSKQPFFLKEYSPGRGGLIWAVIDVDSPDVDVSIRLDDLVWIFGLDTLLTQGLQQPLFPGAWLSRSDAGPPAHYCLVFSAGTVQGFPYSARMGIYVTYRGTGTATLYQGRGVGWKDIG